MATDDLNRQRQIGDMMTNPPRSTQSFNQNNSNVDPNDRIDEQLIKQADCYLKKIYTEDKEQAEKGLRYVISKMNDGTFARFCKDIPSKNDKTISDQMLNETLKIRISINQGRNDYTFHKSREIDVFNIKIKDIKNSFSTVLSDAAKDETLFQKNWPIVKDNSDIKNNTLNMPDNKNILNLVYLIHAIADAQEMRKALLGGQINLIGEICNDTQTWLKTNNNTPPEAKEALIQLVNTTADIALNRAKQNAGTAEERDYHSGRSGKSNTHVLDQFPFSPYALEQKRAR